MVLSSTAQLSAVASTVVALLLVRPYAVHAKLAPLVTALKAFAPVVVSIAVDVMLDRAAIYRPDSEVPSSGVLLTQQDEQALSPFVFARAVLSLAKGSFEAAVIPRFAVLCHASASGIFATSCGLTSAGPAAQNGRLFEAALGVMAGCDHSLEFLAGYVSPIALRAMDDIENPVPVSG